MYTYNEYQRQVLLVTLVKPYFASVTCFLTPNYAYHKAEDGSKIPHNCVCTPKGQEHGQWNMRDTANTTECNKT